MIEKKSAAGKKAPSDLMTQAEAAELRGLDLQVVNNWVRRGRVRSYEQYGKNLVSRSEVLSYMPPGPGRPGKTEQTAGPGKKSPGPDGKVVVKPKLGKQDGKK